MNSSPVRVRFAPSPTGFLHIGGVRTALFNYLFARQKGGQFLLRIEDTDVERSEPRFTQDILSSLKWIGMEADEPILYQSQRLEIYQKIADQLVEKGLAYRCYCTEAEVEAGRNRMIEEGKKPMYARTCRDKNEAPQGRPHAVRAKFPLRGETSFTDLIRGEISFPNEDLDDFVMIRSNGVPTYNFVVVIDDIQMKISHVIRGDDHINNTPKQAFVYHALEVKQPFFAHLPMILGQDKKKRSKRNGETSTNAYRDQGYLPEALLNFLVRLGWSHGDQEIFTREEMIALFNLEHVQVSGAVFNTEKLNWIAGEHMKQADPVRLISIIKEDFAKLLSEASFSELDSPFALKLIPHLQGKAKLVKELAEQLDPLLDPGVRSVDSSTLKWNKDESQKARIKEAIAELIRHFESVVQPGSGTNLFSCGVDHAAIDSLLRGHAEKFGVKLGDLTQPLRLFVTGHPNASVGLFDLLPLMPWVTLQKRLNSALNG